MSAPWRRSFAAALWAAVLAAHAPSPYDGLPPALSWLKPLDGDGPTPRKPCFSRDDCDRKAYDESGTRGRMGLGADPAHPEGPGNVSN